MPFYKLNWPFADHLIQSHVKVDAIPPDGGHRKEKKLLKNYLDYLFAIIISEFIIK